jgi:hypothetical protein
MEIEIDGNIKSVIVHSFMRWRWWRLHLNKVHANLIHLMTKLLPLLSFWFFTSDACMYAVVELDSNIREGHLVIKTWYQANVIHLYFIWTKNNM